MGSPAPATAQLKSTAEVQDRDQLRLRRRTIRQVLEQCQRALEELESSDPNTDVTGDAEEEDAVEGSSANARGYEADELCELLKSKVESPDFLQKLGSQNSAISNGAFEEVASWTIITATDIWEGNSNGDNESEEDGYILVKQEDITDGIACFMTAYLLSLKKTKDLTPTQIQKGYCFDIGEAKAVCFIFFCFINELYLSGNIVMVNLTLLFPSVALSKTFSVKKKKSKLRKAWDGSKFAYNVASWGATAIGIYQNPVLLRAASTAFWTSCRVVSKVL